MPKIWFFLLFYFVPLVADTPEVEGCRKEIQQIDKQIQKLEAEKKKHQDLSRKYQKEGDQWKYNTGRIEDAHKAWGMADQERIKATQIQFQIDTLSDRKQRILQFYPQLWQQP